MLAVFAHNHNNIVWVCNHLETLHAAFNRFECLSQAAKAGMLGPMLSDHDHYQNGSVSTVFNNTELRDLSECWASPPGIEHSVSEHLDKLIDYYMCQAI